MTRRSSTLILAAALSISATGTAQAQTERLHIGPRMSYHFDAEKLGLGVQLGIPIARHIEFYPSVDNFFVDRGSFVSVNADVKLRLPLETTNWLYLGTGFNLARTSYREASDTRAGVNFLVGAESLRGRVHPFGELRVTANDGTSAQLALGLNITVRD